jgi:hypothetical protein
LEELLDKKFVISLDENGLVWIKDWRENNFIRKDRYSPSSHVGLLEKKDEYIARLTTGQPTVNQRSTQYSIVKLSKGKGSMETTYERQKGEGDQKKVEQSDLEQTKKENWLKKLKNEARQINKLKND